MSNAQRTGLCPCCDRFIGPVRTCPYCSEAAVENRSVRILRPASVCLALVGLVFLYVAAARTDPPAVSIGNVNPTMNFARVRMRGTMTRAPYVSRDNGEIDYLSFQMDDATGRLRVAVRGKVAAAIVSRAPLPRPGARVDVVGNLRFSSRGRPKLYVQSADDLILREPGR